MDSCANLTGVPTEKMTRLNSSETPGGPATRSVGCCLIAAAVWLCLAGSTTHAAEVLLAPPGSEAWRPLTFSSVKRGTKYRPVTIDGQQVIRADAVCSASALYLPVDVDLDRTPRLRWRWKVARGLVAHDERVKGGDDFAARVYVMFRFDRSRASVWDRIRHDFGQRIYGNELPGNAINYVWSSREPAGSTWDNPHASASKMISLGAGRSTDWKTEEVDIVADYAAAFGESPPPVLGFALMSDSDNSCQKTTAYFADFQLDGAPGAAKDVAETR